MQKARGENLKGGPQVGHAKLYDIVCRTRTPGPQVVLYKAQGDIKWWSCKEPEPWKPQTVNAGRHQCSQTPIYNFLYGVVRVAVRNGVRIVGLGFEVKG